MISPKKTGNVKEFQYQQAITAEHWIDHQCYHYEYLTVKDNTIAKQQQSKYVDAFVFGSWALSSSKCTFAVQINKIDILIGVGVADEQYKQREYLKKEECPNWIRYNSNGSIVSKQQQTDGHAVSK